MKEIRDWLLAAGEQAVAWVVLIKGAVIWAPFLLGCLLGWVVGSSIATQDLTTGWSGLIVGGLIGLFATLIYEKTSREIETVAARKPLNKVLGPVARNPVTIYLAPFERPLDSELRRLNRADPYSPTTLVRGTPLVVGAGDTLALSYIYAVLLKAGKRPEELTINQSPDFDKGRWGVNFITIGAANARTREVLESFAHTFYTFDDDFSSIVRHPLDPGAVAPITKSDGTKIERRYRKKVRISGQKDYGLILKLQDQARDEGNRIIIVAGLGGDGTSGAAFFLWRHYERLAKFGDTFGVLIQTTAGHESARIVDFDAVAIPTPIFE